MQRHRLIIILGRWELYINFFYLEAQLVFDSNLIYIMFFFIL